MSTDESTNEDMALRESLHKSRDDQQTVLDTWILKLSVAAIGLSMAFRDVVSTQSLCGRLTLIASWIMWFGAIVTVLGSFVLSRVLHDRAIRYLDIGQDDPHSLTLDLLMDLLSYASYALFILGCLPFLALAVGRLLL